LEENKAIIRRLTEADNKHDVSLLDEFISPDYFSRALRTQSREEYKELMTMIFNVFPDWHESIEDIIAEGDKVWYRVAITGTHKGEFRGYVPLIGKRVRIVPTGNKFTAMEVSMKRIVNGKVVESWAVNDYLDFYRQLGIIEYKDLPEDVS
jgi:C-1 hydroxylase